MDVEKDSQLGGPTSSTATSTVSNMSSTVAKPMTHVVSNTSVKAPPESTAPMLEDPPAAEAVAVSQEDIVLPDVNKLPSRVSLSPDFISTNEYSGEEKKDEDVAQEADVKMPPAATTTTKLPSTAHEDQSNKKQSSEQEEDSEPRRTGRKRTSTTMIIDGHVVKKQNNYTVTGINYIHGAYKEDAPKPVKKAKPTSNGTNQQPRAPRKMPSYVTDRHKHNEIIKQRIMGNDATNQLNFMTNNYDVLEPFVDDKVKSLLLGNKKKMMMKSNDEPKKNRPMLGVQPEIVTTTLRDYQMIGLDWMVQMHSRGVSLFLFCVYIYIQVIAFILYPQPLSSHTSFHPPHHFISYISPYNSHCKSNCNVNKFTTLLLQMLHMWTTHTNGSGNCNLQKVTRTIIEGTSCPDRRRDCQPRRYRRATITGFNDILACRVVFILSNWIGNVLFVGTGRTELPGGRGRYCIPNTNHKVGSGVVGTDTKDIDESTR